MDDSLHELAKDRTVLVHRDRTRSVLCNRPVKD